MGASCEQSIGGSLSQTPAAEMQGKVVSAPFQGRMGVDTQSRVPGAVGLISLGSWVAPVPKIRLGGHLSIKSVDKDQLPSSRVGLEFGSR